MELYAGLGPVSGRTKGYTPDNTATTQVTLTILDGFERANAGIAIGIVASAACYVAFGSSAVTIDTSHDVFVPANTPMLLHSMGAYLGLRGVAGASTVRLWPASRR